MAVQRDADDRAGKMVLRDVWLHDAVDDALDGAVFRRQRRYDRRGESAARTSSCAPQIA